MKHGDLTSRSAQGRPQSILILGGGFTGLRIAYLLDQLGHAVTLVEAGHQLGGMVGSFTRTCLEKKFLFDFGPHLFFKEYLDDYRKLLGDDMLPISGRFTMYAMGAMLSYPVQPVEMLSKLGLVKSAAYIADYLAQKIRPTKPRSTSENLADAMASRFGKRLFNDFYAPYIEKCCGLTVEETDIMWARERENVSGRSLASNLWNKARAKLSATVRTKLASTNDPAAQSITAWYPRHGSAQLCRAMEDRLQNTNILLDSKVVDVQLCNGLCQSVVVRDSHGRLRSLSADLIVSTIPLPVLAPMLMPNDPQIAQASARLRYRVVRLVNLIIHQPFVLEDSLEMFSMDARHLFKRVYEPKAMSPDMAPPDMTSLTLEVCCTEGDSVSKMPDASLADACAKSLESIGLLDLSKVVDAFVVNMPHAYPIYHKGFQSDRQLLLDAIAATPNLVTCGRQGLFRYHSMTNEVMETAESIVRLVEAGGDKSSADNNRSQWGQSFY